jgi:hypothetical protein
MRTRIQDYDLTLDDLAQFPSWEYALDEEEHEDQDERTVRPYSAKPPLEQGQAYLIVRASFYLADGTRMTGYIKPLELDDASRLKPLIPADMDPVIVTSQGQIEFWYGASQPDLDELARNYARLNKGPLEVFPIRFASDVEVLNSITEGVLEGFLYCDKGLPDVFNMEPSDVKAIR